jgi:hypothetical protein
MNRAVYKSSTNALKLHLSFDLKRMIPGVPENWLPFLSKITALLIVFSKDKQKAERVSTR